MLGPGQVVVEAAFANITFVETQIRAGQPPNPAMAPALPAVLGNGVGGIVSVVGEGADPALAGTRVVTSTGGRGGYAQRCAVPADGLIPVPDLLPTDEAVALLADGRTALALADAADPRPGETVLIEAAAGGVGSLLVQLAKQAGARVVALAGGRASSPSPGSWAPTWPSTTARQAGRRWCAARQGRPMSSTTASAARPGATPSPCCGRRAATPAFGMASGSFAAIPDAAEPGITRFRFGAGQPLPRAPGSPGARLTWSRQAAALHPVIGQCFLLDRAADAHAAIEARATIGKTLLIASAEGPR